MKNQNALRELALKYFGGKATGDEEKELFGYIGQDASCLETFRGWERDWAASGLADPETLGEWRRLQSRIRMRAQMQEPERFTPRIRLIRKAASIAAVTILGLFGAFGLWKAIESAMPTEYYTVEAPLGEKSRIILSDGTQVWLNAGTTLRYSDRFGRSDRRVELSGEAYFEVAKNSGKEFSVGTRDYRVVVKGTKFNVSAYPDDPFVSTTLSEGKVEVVRGKQHIDMLPGQSLKLDIASGRFTMNDVDADLAHCWIENRIEYNNITLGELMAKLSRRYNVKITLESDRADQTYFHISLRNDETISDVIDGLQEIIPLNVRRDGDNIYLKQK